MKSAPIQILTSESLRQLELLKLRSRRKFLGSKQGGNISPKRGHGIEFADYRRYSLGDNPRHIDWGVFARTDKLYVKQFQEEQDFTLYCLIDCSASMHEPKSDNKYLSAVEIATGFSYIAISQNERVIIEPLGHNSLGRVGNVAKLSETAKKIIDYKAADRETFQNSINKFTYSVNFPGICIILSDFMMPINTIQTLFEGLYTRNLEILAIRLIGTHDINPFLTKSNDIYIDSETGEEIELEPSEENLAEYQFYYSKHSTELNKLVNKYQIKLLDWNASQRAIEFFTEKISNTSILRN